MAEGLVLVDMEAFVAKDVLETLDMLLCRSSFQNSDPTTIRIYGNIIKRINNTLDISEY